MLLLQFFSSSQWLDLVLREYLHSYCLGMLRIKQEELQRGPLTGVLLFHIPVTLSRYSLSLKVSLIVENKDDVTSCKGAIIIAFVTADANCKGPVNPFPEVIFYACKLSVIT